MKFLSMFRRSPISDDGRNQSVGRRNGRKLDLEKRFSQIERMKLGSTSQFYRVRDNTNQAWQGLKLINMEKAKPFRDRYKDLKFPSEGALMAQVDHPSVVELFEYGATRAGDEYLLLEWMQGPRLDQALQQNLIKSLSYRLELVRRIAETVEAVHQAGIIHRDICPRNFIFDQAQSQAKLFDFGLSVPDLPVYRNRLARVGTPLFMAPEVVRRRPISKQTDLFSFGVTAYLLLSRQHPWGVTENSSKSALLFDSTPATPLKQLMPMLADRITDAIDRCLSVQPEQRFSSCRHFLAAAGDFRSDSAIVRHHQSDDDLPETAEI